MPSNLGFVRAIKAVPVQGTPFRGFSIYITTDAKHICAQGTPSAAVDLNSYLLCVS